MSTLNDVIASYEGTKELLYSDPKNPYESIYIRAEISNGQLKVTDSECEHAPDGGWSHRILVFDADNTKKAFLMLSEIKPNPLSALKSLLGYHERTGVFRKMCDDRGIEYKMLYAF